MWLLNAFSAAYCAVYIVIYTKKNETTMAAIMAALLVLNMVFVVRGY